MRVYQIYFKEEQLPKLEPEYIPLFNPHATEYFESEVIAKLVTDRWHIDQPYFGVVSHKLREKIGIITREMWKSNKNIANQSTQNFTPQQFEEQLYAAKPDAMSFQRHAGHDCIQVADGFHPGFKKYWTEIMRLIDMPWAPTSYEDVFYCNFFVAKSEIYGRYVNEMLIPAIQVMRLMPELWNNSGYGQPFPKELQDRWQIKHWPFHAFICERFFTHFAHVHNLKCLHY